jgi:hypothetical protein
MPAASHENGLGRMGPGEVIRHLPIAALVVEAPSGRLVHINARARDMVERQIGRAIPSELTSDWEIFHPDGRPYAMDEWPLVRSLRTGEVVVNEEYFSLLVDGSRPSAAARHPSTTTARSSARCWSWTT